MRASALVLLLAVVSAGCTVTARVTSYDSFSKAVDAAVADFRREGFSLLDVERSVQSEASLSARSYGINNVPSIQSAGEIMSSSPDGRHGFFGQNRSESISTDTYIFANGDGDTVRCSVSYRAGFSPQSRLVHLTEVSTAGCEVSNPDHQERFCGAASPFHRFDSLPQDTVVVL